jgi:hypothetical protein
MKKVGRNDYFQFIYPFTNELWMAYILAIIIFCLGFFYTGRKNFLIIDRLNEIIKNKSCRKDKATPVKGETHATELNTMVRGKLILTKNQRKKHEFINCSCSASASVVVTTS